MTDSVLESVKLYLGLEKDYTPFDPQIITIINAGLNNIWQVVQNTNSEVLVKGYETTWGECLSGIFDLSEAQLYLCMYVRLIFDPPSNSFVINSMQRQIDELVWRLNVRGG